MPNLEYTSFLLFVDLSSLSVHIFVMHYVVVLCGQQMNLEGLVNSPSCYLC